MLKTCASRISLGVFLGIQEIGKLREWIYTGGWVVLTMLLIPFIFYSVSAFLTMEDLQLKATIIDAAMPLGITPYALALEYNTKPKLVARIVVLGTLLSTIIIPLWIMWVK